MREHPFHAEWKAANAASGAEADLSESRRSADPNRFAQQPLNMVLHCPACGLQHVDVPEPVDKWTNPPRRSHHCHGCGHIWRPADVPTNGVKAVKTAGKSDSPIKEPVQQPKSHSKLFCDLKTDEEKSNFFLSGKGYETGVIAAAIQNDVALAYHRCAEYKKAFARQPERVPLTEAQLKQIHHIEEFGLFCDYSEFEQIARAIEQFHGIKPKEQSND